MKQLTTQSVSQSVNQACMIYLCGSSDIITPSESAELDTLGTGI